MKDSPNNVKPIENKALATDSPSDISLLNSTDNTAPTPNLSHKNKEVSRFPIAEINIIGFK